MTAYAIPSPFPIPLTVQKPLWEKQQFAIDFCISRGADGWGLLCDRGTGKTRITIELIKYYFDNEDVTLGFIAAPISVLGVWTHEWALWGDRNVLFIDLSEMREEGLRKAKAFSEAGCKVICLINYDSAWRLGYEYKGVPKRVSLSAEEKVEAKKQGLPLSKIIEVKDYVKVDTSMEDIEWGFGILDESQKIKNHTSRTSKFFWKKLSPKVKYRGILTGSAYTKSPLGVWAQVKYITQDQYFQTSYTAFSQHFSIPHPKVHGAIIGYQNLDRLVRILNHSCVLLKKEEVVEIPPATHEIRLVKLTPKVKAIYDKFKKDCYAELEAEEAKLKKNSEDDELSGSARVLLANHIFAKMMRLSQITSGYIVNQYDVDEEGIINEAEATNKEPIFLGSNKITEMIDILRDKDSEHPTIIVAQRDYEEKIISDAIEAEFKFNPKVLNGAVKGREKRHQMVIDAAKDGILIVKEEVACRGLDMRDYDLTIYYSHRPMTEAYEQMNDRTHRGGQEKSVSYIHLITEKTVDERTWEILTTDLARAENLEDKWRKIIMGEDEDDL